MQPLAVFFFHLADYYTHPDTSFSVEMKKARQNVPSVIGSNKRFAGLLVTYSFLQCLRQKVLRSNPLANSWHETRP